MAVRTRHTDLNIDLRDRLGMSDLAELECSALAAGARKDQVAQFDEWVADALTEAANSIEGWRAPATEPHFGGSRV